MMTISVANELSSLSPLILGLESNVRETIDEAGGIGKGAVPKKIRQEGRFDIVIRYADDSPRGIVEIKNRVCGYSKTCSSDIERIMRTLNRNNNNSTLDFGAFAFFVAYDKSPRGRKSAIERVQQTIDNFREKIRSHDKKNGFNIKFAYRAYDEGESAWAACCCTFKPAN